MDRIEQENPAELKRKLSRRLGLAGLLIVVLLGALAAFDHLSQMEREAADDGAAVSPMPPRLGPSISSPRPEDVAPPPTDEPIKPSAALMPKDAPPSEPPPPAPEVEAKPALTAPSVPPSAPAPAAPAQAVRPVAPPVPVAGAPRPAAPPGPATSAVSATPAIAPPSPAPAEVAAASVAVPEGTASAPMVGAPVPASARPAAPAPASPRPMLSRLASGYVLQAGVFTSTERAEELKAKLVMAGVPVRIETRVQVGPFATQKEADEARRKIRQLGIDSIVIPPRAGRR